MGVKLIMNWDIKAGMDQDYFEFVVREWIPATQKLGLQTTAAWYTVYSRDNAPQIMAEAVAEDLTTMRQILNHPEWERIHEKLMDYVQNYSHKVVNVTGDFQL